MTISASCCLGLMAGPVAVNLQYWIAAERSQGTPKPGRKCDMIGTWECNMLSWCDLSCMPHLVTRSRSWLNIQHPYTQAHLRSFDTAYFSNWIQEIRGIHDTEKPLYREARKAAVQTPLPPEVQENIQESDPEESPAKSGEVPGTNAKESDACITSAKKKRQPRKLDFGIAPFTPRDLHLMTVLC